MLSGVMAPDVLNFYGVCPYGTTILRAGVSSLLTPTYSNNLDPSLSSMFEIVKYNPSIFLAT